MNTKNQRGGSRGYQGSPGHGSKGELDIDVDADLENAVSDGQNEGEGSRTAARRYNQATEDYARSGKVEPKAREAQEALDSDEADDLYEAEQIGKQGGSNIGGVGYSGGGGSGISGSGASSW
jgi:hypothetical protein